MVLAKVVGAVKAGPGNDLERLPLGFDSPRLHTLHAPRGACVHQRRYSAAKCTLQPSPGMGERRSVVWHTARTLSGFLSESGRLRPTALPSSLIRTSLGVKQFWFARRT